LWYQTRFRQSLNGAQCSRMGATDSVSWEVEKQTSREDIKCPEGEVVPSLDRRPTSFGGGRIVYLLFQCTCCRERCDGGPSISLRLWIKERWTWLYFLESCCYNRCEIGGMLYIEIIELIFLKCVLLYCWDWIALCSALCRALFPMTYQGCQACSWLSQTGKGLQLIVFFQMQSFLAEPATTEKATRTQTS